MRGTIVFVIAFVTFLAVTFAYPELPPSSMITDAMDIDPTIEWSGPVVKTLGLSNTKRSNLRPNNMANLHNSGKSKKTKTPSLFT